MAVGIEKSGLIEDVRERSDQQKLDVDLLLREREGGIKGDTQVSGLGNQWILIPFPKLHTKGGRH